jgi:LacI family transcriptional regulator
VNVTIDEVARLAGVSRSTVSLVLRGSSGVADGTRTRVHEAIDRLGYERSQFAAGLRSRQSYLVGLVVSSLTFPHHAQIALGVEEAIERSGYSVLVANSRGDVARERGHVERLRRYHADGLLITPLQVRPVDAAHLVALRAGGYPVVTAYREIPGLDVDFVGVDFRASVALAVNHLAGLGHRRIAFLAGDADSPVRAMRIAGWRAQLRTHGLEDDDALLVTETDGAFTGQAATEVLLARGVSFTALVGANDFFALGALRALYRAGRRVPVDVSVTGIGGFDETMSPERRLTTVVHDFRRVGRLAGELLLERMERPWQMAQHGRERRIVDACLREGETTAPPV